jgi:hypothetical protein
MMTQKRRLKEEAIKVSMAMALMGGLFTKVIQIKKT